MRKSLLGKGSGKEDIEDEGRFQTSEMRVMIGGGRDSYYLTSSLISHYVTDQKEISR